MKINSISYSMRNHNFCGNIKPKLPKTIFERLGVDMTTEVGYKGEPNFTPAPPEVGEGLRKLGVNWSTRVDENSKKGGLFD